MAAKDVDGSGRDRTMLGAARWPGMPFRRLLRPALLRSLSTSVRWLTAAGLVALCFGLRLWLFGQSEVLPYLLFLPAIVVSAVVLDRGSGIFATLLSAPVALYHFVPPIGSFAIPDTQTALSIGLFVGIGLFISVVTEALHLSYVATAEAQQAAEQARERAERSEQQMHWHCQVGAVWLRRGGWAKVVG